MTIGYPKQSLNISHSLDKLILPIDFQKNMLMSRLQTFVIGLKQCCASNYISCCLGVKSMSVLDMSSIVIASIWVLCDSSMLKQGKFLCGMAVRQEDKWHQ